MDKRQERWSESIKDLLKSHNLTARAAAAKSNYAVSHVYIGDWMNGKIPTYEKAVKFLSHFPKNEAISCLDAAEYSIPEGWREPDNSDPLISGLVERLHITTRDGKVTEEQRREVNILVNKILDELASRKE